MMSPHSINVRATLPSDFEALLAMKSDPEDVKWSGFAGPPDPHDFRRWFEQAIVDPDRVMFTGVVNGAVCGYVHFSRVPPKTFSFSIGITSEFRGRGISAVMRRLAVDALRAVYPYAEIEAWVAESHFDAQHRLGKAGYRPTDTTREHQFSSSGRIEVMRRWVQCPNDE